MIADKMPDQLKLPDELWEDYLNLWGYTPQKPKKKAYKQNDKAIKQWLKKEVNEIMRFRQKDLFF